MPNKNIELYRPGLNGCTDGGCIFQDNSNKMHTNGTCRCETELRRNPQGLAAIQTIHFLREQLEDLISDDVEENNDSVETWFASGIGYHSDGKQYRVNSTFDVAPWLSAAGIEDVKQHFSDLSLNNTGVKVDPDNFHIISMTRLRG